MYECIWHLYIAPLYSVHTLWYSSGANCLITMTHEGGRELSRPSVFSTIVHAFICSRIDYCNSLLAGLPKLRLTPLQSVLNAAARLIARLPKFAHISTYMSEVLHWLPITLRIRYKILFLVSKSQLGLAPKYLSDFMRKPLSATSLRSLRSTDRLDLFVPRTRTALAQRRSFAVVGPSAWNDLPLLCGQNYCLGSPPHLLVP